MNTLRATFKFVGILVIMSLGTVFSASTAGSSSYGDPGVVRGGGVGVAVASVVSGGSGSALPMRGPGVDSIPTEGIIYYVPLSEAEPFPWRATDEVLLRKAIDESSLGLVPEQAPNVFYVTDAWADRLKREAGSAPAELYYILEDDETRTLMSCSNQTLVRDLIKDSGCKHLPHHAGNVFMIKKEWESALTKAGATPIPLGFIVKGDSTNTILSSPNKSLVTRAIVESGLGHATGYEANVFYIVSSQEKIIREDVDKNYLPSYVPQGYTIYNMDIHGYVPDRNFKERKFVYNFSCFYPNNLEVWWAIYNSNLGIYSDDSPSYRRYSFLFEYDDYHRPKVAGPYLVTTEWHSILRSKQIAREEARRALNPPSRQSSCCVQ